MQHNMQAFNDSTYSLCSMSFSQLKKLNDQNNAGISKKRLAKLCLENVYILKLFELYGFKTLNNVEAVEKIDNNKVGWILGFLISELNSDNGFLNTKQSLLDQIKDFFFH